jgi:hypothetical protein
MSTMRRLLPVATAVAFAFCAYAIQSVELPGRVVACSCRTMAPLAEAATGPDVALVVATVGTTAGARREGPTNLAIERAFTGQLPPHILVQGIGSATPACQLGARTGERWILGVYRSPDGTFGVSSCGIGGKLGTDFGDALLAEAVGLFGEGQTPAPPPEAPAAPVDVAPWVGGWGWLAALVVVSVAVFGLIAFAATRRRTP